VRTGVPTAVFDCNIYLQAAVRDTGPAFACLSAAEPYINLAIATGAHFLVSRDKDLLELSNYDSADEKNLLKLSPSLQVLDPVALLRRLM